MHGNHLPMNTFAAELSYSSNGGKIIFERSEMISEVILLTSFGRGGICIENSFGNQIFVIKSVASRISIYSCFVLLSFWLLHMINTFETQRNTLKEAQQK